VADAVLFARFQFGHGAPIRQQKDRVVPESVMTCGSCGDHPFAGTVPLGNNSGTVGQRDRAVKTSRPLCRWHSDQLCEQMRDIAPIVGRLARIPGREYSRRATQVIDLEARVISHNKVP